MIEFMISLFYYICHIFGSWYTLDDKKEFISDYNMNTIMSNKETIPL